MSSPDDAYSQLAPLLRCPVCAASMVLGANAVCEQGHAFPIEQGVVRLVPELAGDDREAGLVAATSASFGRQWVELADKAGVELADLELHLPAGWSVGVFGGLVLDAGCGMGRYAALVASLGPTVVGLDLSRAVDKAAELWPEILFVQGDLRHPPLAAESFDVVYSFGVLHHLPGPLEGFRQCWAIVKPGGLLLVWVYSDHGGLLRRGRRAGRRLVASFPPLLRPLALGAATALTVGYVVPRRLLAARGGKLAFYEGKGFSQLYTDCYDALAAPVEAYLSAADCRAWLAQCDAAESGFERRSDGSGWIIWARR